MRYQVKYTVRNNTAWSAPIGYGKKRSEVVWLAEALAAHDDFQEGAGVMVLDTNDNSIAALYIREQGKAVLKVKDNCPFANAVIDVDALPQESLLMLETVVA